MVFTPNTSQLKNINVNGLEALTLQSRTGDTFASYPAPRCRRKPLTQDLLDAEGGEFVEATLLWQVWNVGLTVAPKVGDRLTDSAGIVYEVRRVELRTLRDRYECFCVQDVT